MSDTSPKTLSPTSLSSASRWGIVVMLMIYAALGHFNRVGISVAGTEIFIRKKGIDETSMGWVYTTLLIVYTIGMLPGGWLIDRFGSGIVLTCFGVLMGSFVVLTGMLGWVTTSNESLWIGLLIVRGFAGMANAPLHPGAAHVVSDLMSERTRATANGMVTAGALIGVASCYPIFGWLMDRLNWEWAFIVSGGLLIAYGMLWRRIAVPVLPRETDFHHPHAVAPGLRHSAWPMLWNRNLWLIATSYAAFGYFQYLFFYWMGHYFEQVLHVPDIESRRLSCYINLAQGAGMALGGLSTDAICRWLGLAQGRRSIVMTGMGLAAVFGILGVGMTNHLSVALFLGLSMASLGICEGVFWTTATDIGGKSRGFAGAFMNTLGNVGGLISPVLTPHLAKGLGWNGSIAVACAICFLGGALWFAVNLKPKGTH